VTRTAIRAVRETDFEAVGGLLMDAFGGPAEAALVEALRAAGDVALEQVAVDGEEIVGYIGYAGLFLVPENVAAAAEAGPFSARPRVSGDPEGRPELGPRVRGDERSASDDGAPSLAASRLAGHDTGWVCRPVALAPLAVDAAWRRQGIGEALVRGSLDALRASGFDLVLVLGDPAYYDRFGFVPAADFGLRTLYDGPYQQALALNERGRGARGLAVSYPEAFAGLE
jgi:putative acetyltransferase